MAPNKTQKQIIREHLESGKPLTSWDAIQLYHITRLAAYIKMLKDEGLEIDSEDVTTNGKTYSRYWARLGQMKLAV